MKLNRKLFFLCLIFLVFSVFGLPFNSSAANLHTLSDKMSRHAPSIGADHEFKFTTPTGVSSSGQYISIIFDSGFDLNNVDYTDMDLFHGPVTGFETSETLVANADSNSWGVSAFGNQINFYHPLSNVNGNIGPGEKIVIRVGLNAVLGNLQIINPATIGSKVISIAGNFGDSGKLAVPIFQDQIGVGGQTASAPPTPVILDPPFNITRTSMDLHWSTNTDLDFTRYEVYYSTASGVSNITGILATTLFSNNQTNTSVTGLAENTIYYFVVYVYDNEGLFAPSNIVSAKTLSGGVIVPPPPPAEPIIDELDCPFFHLPALVTGTMSAGSIVYVNGSSSNVNYPTATTWSVLLPILELGENPIELMARDTYGQISPVVQTFVKYWRIGDNLGNYRVTDFQLSGLAYYWNSNYCFSDFKEDGHIDDFDLAGLAAHWDGIYKVISVPDCPMLGDLDGDWDIDLIDFNIVKSMVEGKTPYHSCGDINRDTLIGPTDYARMWDEANGWTNGFDYN